MTFQIFDILNATLTHITTAAMIAAASYFVLAFVSSFTTTAPKAIANVEPVEPAAAPEPSLEQTPIIIATGFVGTIEEVAPVATSALQKRHQDAISELKSKSIRELKKLASVARIKGYGSMKKAELISALT